MKHIFQTFIYLTIKSCGYIRNKSTLAGCLRHEEGPSPETVSGDREKEPRGGLAGPARQEEGESLAGGVDTSLSCFTNFQRCQFRQQILTHLLGLRTQKSRPVISNAARDGFLSTSTLYSHFQCILETLSCILSFSKRPFVDEKKLKVCRCVLTRADYEALAASGRQFINTPHLESAVTSH